MRIKFLQKIIDKIRRKNKFEPKNYDISTVYGKIYHPIYNLNAPIYGKNPDVYDKDGNRLEYFFLRDIHYTNFTRAYSKYFLWDKFNFNLDIHFYSGKSMLETMGNPLKRYGFFPEPYSIAPYDYNIFKTKKGIEKDFDAFAFQTIPIYLGATKIDKFFNPDGIIKLNLNDDIEKVLKQCTEEEYNRRLPAVLENYKIALKYGYLEQWNFIYENYLTDKIISEKNTLNNLFSMKQEGKYDYKQAFNFNPVSLF